MVTKRTFSANSIDRDGDTLVDITSLECLDNMRYNLDLGAPADAATSTPADDGRYKDSTQIADGEGLLCGSDSNTKCTGYELMRSLDFADAGSYEGGSIVTNWRPNNADPAMATNAGWDPIGGNFATRFEGNGYTIRNLYARNIDDSNGANIGLFATIDIEGTVRSIGIQSAALYGSGAAFDTIGGLAGVNNGSIIASYAHNTTVDGGAGPDSIGGLLGSMSAGHVIASYVSNSTLDSGAGVFDIVGSLVGIIGADTVIASYSRGGTVNGGADTNDIVGGLLGQSTGTFIIATYSTVTANGGGGNNDFVGGLAGLHNGNISASYATGVADGGTPDDTGDRASAFYATRATAGTGITDSYGFGTPVNSDNTGGSNGSTKPTVDGTAITMAEQLTLANAGTTWNSAAHDTLDAWDFGDDTEIPALRYADYDGPGTDYSCGDNDIFTGIPTVAASPTGPIPIECGKTLLPGQRP